MRIRCTAVVACLAIILAACGDTQGREAKTQEQSPWARMSFVQLMRATFSADYDALPSPRSVADATDISVYGHVVSVADGRAVSFGGDAPDYYVTFEIQPVDIIRDDPKRRGRLVYFELPRPDNLGAEVFAEKVPIGTEVMLLGYRVDDSEGDVMDAYAGREDGATIYHPAVQGLFVQTDADGFASVLEPLSDMPARWQGLGSVKDVARAVR